MVGIDEYVRPTIPRLRYAVADAKLFSQALQQSMSVPKDHIFLMTSDAVDEGSQPRFVNIAYRLSYLKGKVKKEDTFIFYFAGHGVTLEGEPFLLTEEADNRNALTLKATSLHTGDLMTTLQKTESGNVWVTLDACRNNPDDPAEAKLDPAVSDSLSKANIGLLRTAAMFSCAVGERAWEWDEKKHGCYSYFLVEGLRREAADSSGRVTLAGLDQYLREQVPSVTQRFGARQNPKMVYGGSHSSPWVLANVPLAASSDSQKKDEQTARFVARLESLQARLDAETALRVQAEQRARLAESQRQQMEQQLAILERQVGIKSTPIPTGPGASPKLLAYADRANPRELISEVNRLRDENEALKRRLASLEAEAGRVGIAPRGLTLESQPLLKSAWEGASQAQTRAEEELGRSTNPEDALQGCLSVRQALTQKMDVWRTAYATLLAQRPLTPGIQQEVMVLKDQLATQELLSDLYHARQDAAATAHKEAGRRLEEALAREEKYRLMIDGLQNKLAQAEEKLARCQVELQQSKGQLSEALRQVKDFQERLSHQKKGAFRQNRWQYETHMRVPQQLWEDTRDPLLEPQQLPEKP